MRHDRRGVRVKRGCACGCEAHRTCSKLAGPNVRLSCSLLWLLVWVSVGVPQRSHSGLSRPAALRATGRDLSVPVGTGRSFGLGPPQDVTGRGPRDPGRDGSGVRGPIKVPGSQVISRRSIVSIVRCCHGVDRRCPNAVGLVDFLDAADTAATWPDGACNGCGLRRRDRTAASQSYASATNAA